MLRLLYPCGRAKSVFVINYNKLYERGFRGIIFDIDNTLVHHGENSTPEVDRLFRKIHATGLKTVLLTDNDEERVRRFVKNINTPFVCDAGKPSPKGYRKALEILNLPKEKVIVIGDQIFTDILGANLSGIKNILVDFIRLDTETYFGKRRQVEAFVLKIYEFNKKYCKRGKHHAKKKTFL